MTTIKLNPVGTVVSDAKNRSDENWGVVVSKIHLHPQYSGALEGLESFSHALVITYMHEARYDKEKHLQRRPRNMETMPLLGIFSQRGKNRPNPIGVTAVEIVSVEKDAITVRGLDMIDGTPVLDIKPYFPQFDRIDAPKIPDWVNSLMKNYF